MNKSKSLVDGRTKGQRKRGDPSELAARRAKFGSSLTEPAIKTTAFERELLSLPPHLMPRSMDTLYGLVRMQTQGFKGLGWYLHQVATELIEGPGTTSNLYLLRGENHLAHVTGVRSSGKNYHPFTMDVEYDLQLPTSAVEAIPLVGLSRPKWPNAFVYVNGNGMRVYNTVVGDSEFVTYAEQVSVGEQRILAPLLISEREVHPLGVWEIRAPDLSFGGFVPENEDQKNAIITLTMRLIAILSSGLSRIIQAKIDPLTALPMKRESKEKVIEAIRQFKKGMLKDFTFFMVDVDDFKTKNERYGHLVGDQVLQAVAANLATLPGFVARRSGDEFNGILLMDEASSFAALDQVREQQGRTIIVTDREERITQTCTVGAVSMRRSIDSGLVNIAMPVEDILLILEKSADDALLHAKHTQKDQVLFWGN